jgi:DNA-directed RNA polymerase specialized sigma24 family protein
MNPHPHVPAAMGTAEAAGPPAGAAGPAAGSAEQAVTALYEAHALGMIRLAHIMLGDRHGAEDVVQEAFCGLYRRWSHLSDPERAVHYVRSAVLSIAERDQIVEAVRRLPPRQRETLVLRFYLDLSAEEAATTMGISPSSVRSATHRALASLGGMLQEQS